MKKTILSLVAITYSIAAFSQMSYKNIEWGDYNEEVVISTSSYFTSGDDENLYLITKGLAGFGTINSESDFWESFGRFYITKYNVNDLNMEYVKAFNVGNTNSAEELVIPSNIIAKNNEVVVFSNKYITEDKVVVAYGQTIDSVGQMGDPVEIGSYVNEDSKSSGEFMYPYSKADDELLSVMIHPMDKYDYVKFTYKIMDLSFTELYKSEITLPYKFKNFGFESYPSSKNGSIYFTGWLKEDSVYAFVKYDIETEEIFTYEVKEFSDDQEPYGFDYSYLNDTIVSFSGYYEDKGIPAKKKKALGKTDGYFYGTLNTNSFEKMTFVIEEFGNDAKGLLLNLKEQKKALKPSLIGNGVFIGNDGGGGLLYNVQYQKKKYERSKQLFFTRVDSLGKPEWNAYIPYNQQLYSTTGMTRFHAGYDYHINGSNVYFIYATHEKNIPEFESERPEKHKTLKKEKNSVAMLSCVYYDGKIETIPLVQTSKMGESLIIPEISYLTDDGELIFFNYKQGTSVYEKSRIGKLQLK